MSGFVVYIKAALVLLSKRVCQEDALLLLAAARIKGKAVWRLSSFSSGKFCELRDFAGGKNLYVLYAKFPPPTPQGRMIAREQGVPRPNVSTFRPRYNIIGPKLCNRLPTSSLEGWSRLEIKGVGPTKRTFVVEN